MARKEGTGLVGFSEELALERNPLAKTLKDLCLALLNATLILLALCLFLGWKLAQSVEAIQDRFAESRQIVLPLADQARDIRSELRAIGQQLTAIRDAAGSGTKSELELNQSLARLDKVQEKLDDAQSKLSDIADNPERLIDHAITTAADAATQRLLLLRGCGDAG